MSLRISGPVERHEFRLSWLELGVQLQTYKMQIGEVGNPLLQHDVG